MGSATMPMAGITLAALSRTNPGAAVALRSDLELTMGAHVLLTVELIRDEMAAAGSERTKAALGAVTDNTHVLSSIITRLYGQRVGALFTEEWLAHIKELSDYANARAGHDAVGQDAAHRSLTKTEGDLGRLLSTATHGALSAATAQAAVRMHVEMLISAADAYDAVDYGRAYALELQGFEHMAMLADTLSRAMASAERFSTRPLDLPSRQLQSALARLFAVHMGLMIEAMRAASARSPDFSSIGVSLNSNTAALGEAVAALYGEPAQAAFLKLWAQHVDALIQYAEAAGRHDRAVMSEATKSMTQVVAGLAKFLATATQERLPAIQLSGALTEHDTELVAQDDAYLSGAYSKSESIAAEGYAHMFTLADTLATSIGDAVAARLPSGGAQTGGGATARRR
jgi:hypothetical protein